MSNTNLEKIIIYDPRLDVNQPFKNWYTMFPASDLTVIRQPTANYSQNSANFQILLNDNNTLIDRSSMIFSMPITIDMTGPGTGAGNCYQAEKEGLRSNPLAKIINNLNFNFNGTSFSYLPYEMEIARERLTNSNNNVNKQLMPTMPDRNQDYAYSYLTNRSPFALYNDNPYEVSRRAYPITVVTNTTTAAKITTTLNMNLFDFSPMSRDNDVIGIHSTPLSINFVFVSNLSRIWSRDLTNHTQPISTFSVTFGAPSIHFVAMTIPRQIPIPPVISYPLEDIVYYPTTTSTTYAQNSTFSIDSNVIQLETTPKKIYIYVKRSTQSVAASLDASVGSSDVFARINTAQVTFGNRNGLLSSYSDYDLWNMSFKNGVEMSYIEWTGSNGSTTTQYLSGSVLAIDPVRDLGLNDDYVVGKADKINFKIQLNVTTLSPNTVSYDMGLLIVYDSILTYSNGQYSKSNVLFNNFNEVQQGVISYNQLRNLSGGYIAGMMASGGSIKGFAKDVWSQIKDFAPTLNKMLKETKAISRLTPAIPYIGQPISNVARTLGYGEGEEGYDELNGGKILTRGDLMSRIKRYENRRR